MTPWWHRHPKQHPLVPHCERCRGTEDVHRGLCRACRGLLLAEETPGGDPGRVTPRPAETPSAPSLEPPHSRPWVHRGGG